MSPRRTRRGTIRETINESSTLSTSKTPRKTRSRINKSHAKGIDEDSDSPVDINNVVITDSTATPSFLNDTSINIRKRRRKEQESVNQNNTLSVTVDESQSSTKTRKTKLKKKTKSDKSQIVDVSSLISEDESFSKKQTEEKSQVEDLISEDEVTEKKVLRKKIKFDNQILSSTAKLCKTPEKISEKASKHDKLSEPDITPKSSPLNVSFTPNRSIKTPKKSPENLGSPKTHSYDSLKSLNVPRKLSIVDSPSSSESSLQQSNVNNKSVGNKSKNLKSPKSASPKKSKSPTLTVRPRFSKSPKIVFKTPKSKSSKKSPKKTLNKSPNVSKTPSPTKSTKVLSSPTKSAKLEKVVSPSKLVEKKLEFSLVNSTASPKQNSINQSQTLPKINSSLESKKSLTSALNSSKSKMTPTQSKVISKVLSSSKLKKSPKFISPLSANKMPKIVLALKSKKSPAKSSKSITPSKVKKSPVKVNKTVSPLKVKTLHVKTNKSISPSKGKKSPVKGKSTTPSKTNKSFEALNSSKTAIKSPRKSTGNNTSLKNTELSPRVIVNKLSSSQLNNSSLGSKTKLPTINLIPVDHTPNKKVSIRKSNSPKSPKLAMVKSLTPTSIRKSQINKSTNRVSVSLKNITPADKLGKRLTNLKPSNTSTPREIKNRATNKVLSSKVSNSSVVFNGSPQPKSKAIKRLDNKSKDASNYQLLDDESEPSMNDSSLINMSDVFDVDVDPSEKNSTFEIDKSNVNNTPKRRSERNSNTTQTSNKNDTFEAEKNISKTSKSGGNNTYELENPKTPALKNKAAKRKLDQIEIDKEGEPDAKKNFKVHFASPNRGREVRSTINRVGTPGHPIQQKRTSLSVRTPTNKALVNKIERKRISSAITPQSRPSVGSAIKRRSTSASDTQTRKSIRETQIASINRLSKPKVSVNSEKKTAVKTPSAKKIPNFSEIHKKNFAKMESIVDLKKRVENRHVNLNTGSSAKKVPGSGSKPTPVDSTNGSYTRFGFKVRKNEAINMISKKQTNPADTREKKREVARSTLKGVRMNRRFELQMKSRTQNS